MKGITHFSVGLALAALYEPSLAMAESGNPLLMLAGGFAGILPDTVDFKFVRYFCRYDVEVVPDPLDPDPAVIAGAFSSAVLSALKDEGGVCIKFHTMRVSADRWRKYNLKVGPGRQITVNTGMIVDGGGNIMDEAAARKAVAELPCEVVMDYLYDVEVSFLEGPTLLLQKSGSCVKSTFIHWHRQWSHSLAGSVCFALAAAAAGGHHAGLVVFAGMCSHILLDSAGYMGCSVYYPFNRRRIRGLKWIHSSEYWMNFAVVWLSLVLVLIKLAPLPAYNPLQLLFWAGIVPAAAGRLILK